MKSSAPVLCKLEYRLSILLISIIIVIMLVASVFNCISLTVTLVIAFIVLSIVLYFLVAHFENKGYIKNNHAVAYSVVDSIVLSIISALIGFMEDLQPTIHLSLLLVVCLIVITISFTSLINADNARKFNNIINHYGINPYRKFLYQFLFRHYVKYQVHLTIKHKINNVLSNKDAIGIKLNNISGVFYTLILGTFACLYIFSVAVIMVFNLSRIWFLGSCILYFIINAVIGLCISNTVKYDYNGKFKKYYNKANWMKIHSSLVIGYISLFGILLTGALSAKGNYEKAIITLAFLVIMPLSVGALYKKTESDFINYIINKKSIEKFFSTSNKK